MGTPRALALFGLASLAAAACGAGAPPPRRPSRRAPAPAPVASARPPAPQCHPVLPGVAEIRSELLAGAPPTGYVECPGHAGENNVPELYALLAGAMADAPACSPADPACEAAWTAHVEWVVQAREAFHVLHCSTQYPRLYAFRDRHAAYVDARVRGYAMRVEDAIADACGADVARRWQERTAPILERRLVQISISCDVEIPWRVPFDRWSASAKADGVHLQQLLGLLARAPCLRLQVRGHEDKIEMRSGIGLRRARAVRAALVAAGVAPDRLTLKNAGYAPVHYGPTRFVEFIILPDDAVPAPRAAGRAGPTNP